MSAPEDDLRVACGMVIDAFVKRGVDCQIEGGTAAAIGEPAAACPYLDDPSGANFERDCWLLGWATEWSRKNVSRETIQ